MLGGENFGERNEHSGRDDGQTEGPAKHFRYDRVGRENGGWKTGGDALHGPHSPRRFQVQFVRGKRPENYLLTQ